jgi:hypothetical protein
MSYCAALLWALVAVIVEQRSTSTITTAAAIIAAIFVLLAAFGTWGAPARSPKRAESAA